MKHKEYDVTALGELLIDFTEDGYSDQGNKLLEVNPGGAPCNVLAMLSKLGKKTAFIGKVGEDQFGKILRETTASIGINVDGLVTDKEVNTTLAFVHNFEDGDRDFTFYRNPGADMMLTKDEVNIDKIKNSKIFHFGTLSFTHQNVEESTKYAIKCAKESGAIISFDPNLREPLWNDLDNAVEAINYGFSLCDILKIADNELLFVTGETDYDIAINKVRQKYDIKLICVTFGKKGSIAYYKNSVIKAKPFINEKTIETTGAGDTFTGCILNYILENDLENLSDEELKQMLIFANAGASLITTKKGALKAMPDKTEIETLIETKK